MAITPPTAAPLLRRIAVLIANLILAPAIYFVAYRAGLKTIPPGLVLVGVLAAITAGALGLRWYFALPAWALIFVVNAYLALLVAVAEDGLP